MSENGLTFLYTEKKISSPWTGRLLFWRPLLKMFDDGPVFFSALSENEEKVIFFFLIYFPEIVPMDRWNAISTIVTKFILREGREMFTNCPKMIRNSNVFKTKNFSPTCSSAHVECNFENSWKGFGNRPKKFVQLPKVIEVQLFRNFFPKIVLMDKSNACTLINPVKNLPQKAEKLTLTVRKWKRKSRVMRSFFPQKCSYSHVKGSFVNPVGTSSLEGQIF